MKPDETQLLLLRTSIKPAVQRIIFFHGFACATGALFLVWLAEVLLPFAGIESLGIWRWIASGGALGASYLPYKKLLQHKLSPEILRVNEQELVLLQKDKPLLRIAWDDVESFTFLDRDSSYGLAFTFKKVLPKISHPPQSALETSIQRLLQSEENEEKLPMSPYKTLGIPLSLLQKSKKMYGVDLFLPFFSQHSYLLLQNWYDQNLLKSL